VWQYNPFALRGYEIGPFVLWDYQEAAYYETPEANGKVGALWLLEREGSMVIDKSREMGATWWLEILQDQQCRYHDWQKWGYISRDADQVDKSGDPDSIFWKLDFIHGNLPTYLQGVCRELKERKRHFKYYPRTRSTVTGEASTGQAFIGGRAQVVIADEFGEVKEDKRVRQKLASSARVFFYNGTHRGTTTQLYQLTKTPEVHKRQFHWVQHPKKNKGLYKVDEKGEVHFYEYVPREGVKEIRGPKDPALTEYDFDRSGKPAGGPHPGLRSPWYDAKEKIGNLRGVAEHLDIDPSGSAYQPFDSVVIRNMLKPQWRPPDWQGDVEFDNRGNLTALVERAGGPLKLWCRLDYNQEPPSAPYAAGADVAQGTGATPSCLSIANARTGEKVLRYANAQIKPDRFALLCAALCRLFHNAVITWEHAGPGVVFGKAITEEAGYWHLALREEDEATASQARVHRFGYAPSPKRKNSLLNRYYLALQKGEYVNFDEPAIDQMLDFEYDAAGHIIHPGEVGDDPNEARENHGDLVIADALSCKMVLDGGSLASRQPAEKPPQLRPEVNILTLEGRRAFRRKQEREKAGW
jgi:hypothetical protein